MTRDVHQTETTNHYIFLITFTGIALKLEKVGPAFSNFKINPCPSFQSVAADERNQFQSLNNILKQFLNCFIIFGIQLLRRKVDSK